MPAPRSVWPHVGASVEHNSLMREFTLTVVTSFPEEMVMLDSEGSLEILERLTKLVQDVMKEAAGG